MERLETIADFLCLIGEMLILQSFEYRLIGFEKFNIYQFP